MRRPALYVYGVDSGPQVAFNPTVVSRLGGGFSFLSLDATPSGLAADAAGNIYFAGWDNGTVQEIPPGRAGAGCVTTLGGGFYLTEDGAVNGAGNVYSADWDVNAVKKMPPGCTAANYSNGACTAITLGGGFSNPQGVAVDGSGNVYVADDIHNAVKEMPPGCASAACVTTLGGGFSDPSSVAVNANGKVYVANWGNQR